MRKKKYITTETIYCDTCHKKVGKKTVELVQGDFCDKKCKELYKKKERTLL